MTEDHRRRADARTLATIADAIGVPLETFFDPIARDPVAPSEAEEAELLGLFREIQDPQRRAQCLALIRGMAGLPDDETGGS